MQDEEITVPIPPARRNGGARKLLTLVVLVLLIGAATAGWLAWQGRLDFIQIGGGARKPPARVAAAPPAVAEAEAVPYAAPIAPAPSVGAVETRLALLEERLSRLDLQARAASGNAARAEGLLIAFAARRAIDRGAPLGYLEDQLRLRFADAQPNAVETIIAAAAQPVTLAQLRSRLDAASPALARGAARDENAWGRVRRELASLLVIRRETAHAAAPEDRIERAKLLLGLGRVDEAIAQIERLPGARGAREWIAAARRHHAAQRALDLIETAAMLEPRRLQDAEGHKIEQPSPLAPPADAADEAI